MVVPSEEMVLATAVAVLGPTSSKTKTSSSKTVKCRTGTGKKETTSSLPTSTGTPVANKTSARSARSKVVSVGAAKLEVLLSHPGEATTATRRKLTKMIGRLIAVTSMFIILQAAIGAGRRYGTTEVGAVTPVGFAEAQGKDPSRVTNEGPPSPGQRSG